jgi:cytochrome c-type biogenesis protein CcmH
MTAGFWLGAAALSLLALSFLAIPLWREQRRSGTVPLSAGLTAAAIVPIAFGLYLAVTSFDPDAASQGISSDDMAMLEQLAARLSDNPNDVEGWKLLGRSYRALGDYDRARLAFEQAWSRTANPDDGFKLSYAEALLFSDPGTAQGLAGNLIEEVLGNAPDSQAALWLGGIVAMEREQPAVAAERFTALLATNPPPDIADIVRRQIVALTGAAPPTSTAPAGAVIDLDIRVGDNISLDQFGPNARLYVFASSTESPMPIAARQESLGSLPGRISLSDSDNPMGAGRPLSEYPSIRVVARISATGVGNEQPGDVYAEAIVTPGSGEPVQLVIDKIVPEG